MNIRIAQQYDIDTLFEIRTSVVENHQYLNWIMVGIEPDGDFSGQIKFIKRRE